MNRGPSILGQHDEKPQRRTLPAGSAATGKKIPPAGTEGHIAKVILAAFNRGILLDHERQPHCTLDDFYKNKIGLNVWCSTIHQNFKDSKVYAFPYDDQCHLYSSTVSVEIPPCSTPTVTWTVTLEKIDWF